MKVYLYITNAEDYFSRGFKRFAAYTDNENMPDNWIFVGEIEFEPKLDEPSLRSTAANNLDRQIKEVQAEAQSRINSLEVRKQQLLCIEHKPESPA